MACPPGADDCGGGVPLSLWVASSFWVDDAVSYGPAERVITRGAMYPTRRQCVIATWVDGLTAMNLYLLQGERLARDNQVLGGLLVSGIPPAPQGHHQVQILLDVDSACDVTLTAICTATDARETLHRRTMGRLLTQEGQRLLEEARAMEEARAACTQAEAHLARLPGPGAVIANTDIRQLQEALFHQCQLASTSLASADVEALRRMAHEVRDLLRIRADGESPELERPEPKCVALDAPSTLSGESSTDEQISELQIRAGTVAAALEEVTSQLWASMHHLRESCVEGLEPQETLRHRGKRLLEASQRLALQSVAAASTCTAASMHCGQSVPEEPAAVSSQDAAEPTAASSSAKPPEREAGRAPKAAAADPRAELDAAEPSSGDLVQLLAKIGQAQLMQYRDKISQEDRGRTAAKIMRMLATFIEDP